MLAGLGVAYRRRLQDLIDEARAVDRPDLIRARPQPEVWSPLEYTAHMRDVIDFYVGRIERVLRENHPVLIGADLASMAETRRYRDENIEAVLVALDRRATAASEQLARLPIADWSRVGLGSEGSERTVLVLARRLAHDGHHHLADLEDVFRRLTQA